MENADMKTLIVAFKGYRDLLSPVQQSLHDFADTYHLLREDINRLNNAFEGDIEGNLERIYKNLASQARQATDLSSRIDNFIKMTEGYTQSITKIADTLEQVVVKMQEMGEIEGKAETQLQKLDETLEEKRKNYNLKELQKTMDNYNANVQRVSEFINKDVIDALIQNNKKMDSIKYGSESIAKRVEEDGKKVEELVSSYKTSNELLKKIVETSDVNESYIYDILDKWAEERRLKIKK